jgi:hypothetical protein
MSMLNRRNALTAVATLPALAAPAAVAGAMPAASEQKLRALEAEIYLAWEHLGSVLEIHLGAAETRLHDWKKANPKPIMRDPTKAESRTLRLAFANGGESSFGEEYEKEYAEHKRVLSAWEVRHETAEKETGCNRAHELESLASERLDAAIMAMCDTPATTIEGFRCKARAAAKVERGNANPDLAWSIVDDLAELVRVMS